MRNIRAKSGKRTREELSCIFGKDYDVAEEEAKSSDSESDSDSSSSSSSEEEEETRAKEPEKKRTKKSQSEDSESESEEEEDSDVDGDKKAESDEKTVTGLKTTVSQVSSDDYFRQKMLQRKQRLEQMRKQQEEQQKEKREEQAVQEVKDEEKNEEQILDDLFADSLEIKETQDKQLEKQINESSSAKPKSYKFRFRLLGCVFACLIALSGGWIIGNIVDIVKTNAQIAEVTQTNNEYSANLAQLIKKISKIETGEQHPSSPSDGSLLPIEEIIPITPEPLEDVTEYEQHSNWFDKICNWLKILFGG